MEDIHTRMLHLSSSLDLLEKVWRVIQDGGAEGMPGDVTWAIGDLLRDTGRITVDPS
jgi:hypothetical protein